MGFNEFYVGKDENDKFRLQAGIRFKSRQPVKVDWKNLDVKLQWRRFYEDQLVIEDVAKFQKNSDFKTQAYEDKNLSPSLVDLSFGQVGQVALLYAACLDDFVQVRFKGHVKSKTSSNKYPIETDWNNVMCYV